MSSAHPLKTFLAQRVTPQLTLEVRDALAVEAVLHVKVNGIAYTTTVRTPGDDRYLVRGLLHTEGVVRPAETTLRYREILDPATRYVGCLEVEAPPMTVVKELEQRRSSMVSASCGLCGTREAAELQLPARPVRASVQGPLDIRVVPAMLEFLSSVQESFNETGGCHAAAAFAIDGEPLAAFEDIGRHNAVDKVIGCLIENGGLPRAAALLVSGRVSYEIVFKAYHAGIPIILAVSAPSSLAVETASQARMTVIGFCRENRATIYSHPQRVLFEKGLRVPVVRLDTECRTIAK